MRKLVVECFLAVCVTGVTAAHAQSSAFSPDIHVSLPAITLADHDVGMGSLSGPGKLNLGNLPNATDVDALHGLPDGNVLFSVDVPTVLGNATYFPSDVIRWNGVLWSLEFNGRASGIPDGVNLDALAVSGNNLLFSIDVSAVLGGTLFTDSDVIAFDGEDFTLYLQASSVGLGQANDVDAVHVNDQGGVLLSFDISESVAGITFADEDLLLRANTSWSLNVDGSTANAAWIAADLDAWSTAFPADIFFKNGFE